MPISGSVYRDGDFAPLAGVTITMSPGDSVSTDVSGIFVFEFVPSAGTTVTVTPTLAGYTFLPPAETFLYDGGAFGLSFAGTAVAGTAVAEYPGSIPSLPGLTPTPGSTTTGTPISGLTHAQRHDRLEVEIVAVAMALGIDPQGPDATVAARLDRMQADIAAAVAAQSAAYDGTSVYDGSTPYDA